MRQLRRAISPLARSTLIVGKLRYLQYFVLVLQRPVLLKERQDSAPRCGAGWAECSALSLERKTRNEFLGWLEKGSGERACGPEIAIEISGHIASSFYFPPLPVASVNNRCFL